MIKPLPCPFCSYAEITVVDGSTFRWRHAACENCGSYGPEVRAQTLGRGTKENWDSVAVHDATYMWNIRTPQTIRIPFSFFSEAERELIQAANPGKIIEDAA